MTVSSLLILLILMVFVANENALFSKVKDKFWKQPAESVSAHTDVDSIEQMMLFPSIGFQRKEGDWRLNLYGWRFQISKRNTILSMSSSAAGQRLARLVATSEQIVYYNDSFNQDRLKPFMVEDNKNEDIHIMIGKKNFTTRTDREGQFRSSFIIPNADVQAIKESLQNDVVITYKAIGDTGDISEGKIHLLERQGLCLVSDIDDTIKISEVVDKIRLIANTFIHGFRVVPGMPEVYRGWQKKNGCSFHYLSAMPDQLYNVTKEFVDANNFPDGTFHMRHFSWASSSIINFIHSTDTKMHKINHLRYFIFNTLRSLVLVGDSGEIDPEIYGSVARMYPKRVRRIFIRAVKGENGSEDRFKKAFKDVPKEKWMIFTDPLKELPKDLDVIPAPETPKAATKKTKPKG